MAKRPKQSERSLFSPVSAVEALRQMAGAVTPPIGATSSLPKPIIAPGDLGEVVRAARKDRKMSQANFADLAGVGRRFLSELEAGKPTLEIGKVLLVLTAAGIELVARDR